MLGDMTDEADRGYRYFQFRDRMAGDIRRRLIGTTPEALVRAAEERAGLPPARAAEWVERLLADIVRHRERRAARKPGSKS